MYSNTSATRITTKINVMVLARASGVLQHDVRHGIAAVAAAIDDLFQQFVQVADHHGLKRLVLAAVDFTEEVEHHVVGLAFNGLQAVVHLLDRSQRRHPPQQSDHLRERFSCPLHQVDLPGKVDDGQTLRGKIKTLGEFFDGLANTVHGIRQGFNVFTFQSGDERVDQFLADLLGDSLVLAASKCELVQRTRMAAVLKQVDQQLCQGTGFVGAGFQQIEELCIAAEEFLNGKHVARLWALIANNSQLILPKWSPVRHA